MTVKKKILNALFPLISIAVFIGIWAIIAAAVGMEIILPSPTESFSRLFELIGSGEFWLVVGNTLAKALISFTLSMVIAIIFATLGGVFPLINKLVSPFVTIFRAVPTMSIILLAIIWFNAKLAPVFVAFLIIFPTLYTAFYSAVSGVDKKVLDMAKSFDVDKKSVITKIYLPMIAPSFFDGIKNGVSLTVKLTIAAEVLSQTRNSMGVNMQLSQIYLDTAGLMGWTIAAVLLCALLEFSVSMIKKFVVRWQ